jgi:uncharacterized protein GlcG (DUF336 family)
MNVITLTEAETIIKAAKMKAEGMGIKVAVAVVDPRGDLIAMARMDGAPWRSIQLCQGKAYATAAYGISSGELQARADHPVVRSLVMMAGGHMVPSPGALPIMRDGEMIGAVGGSGAKPEQDEEVCRAGLAAL